MVNNTPITLSAMNMLIRNVLEAAFGGNQFWVIAEIAEVNCKSHCYLGLVEKVNDKIVAQSKGTIWAYKYREISARFEKATGTSLKPGMQILMLAEVQFHEVYGLKLNILDINPEYSLGEMARKKREVIERLKKEGIFEKNKSLPLPLVPQRVAVISSENAAGLQDFMDQLHRNAYGYRLDTALFPAIMQGENAENSITAALTSIPCDKFDIIALIRGGGSQVDLNCYDGYMVARAIAMSPLPVLTGIGHEKDESVVDMVAHTRLKTPTAVAEFIISGINSFEDRIDALMVKTTRMAGDMVKTGLHMLGMLQKTALQASRSTMTDSMKKVDLLGVRVVSSARPFMERLKAKIDALTEKAKNSVLNAITKEAHRLDKISRSIELLSPKNILKLGYSITFFNGKAIKSAEGLNAGDIIETVLHDGTIKSEVKS